MIGPAGLIAFLLTVFLAGGLWVGFSLLAIGISLLKLSKISRLTGFSR